MNSDTGAVGGALNIKGAPGSPYTLKMLAYMRFRHIPDRLHVGLLRDNASDHCI